MPQTATKPLRDTVLVRVPASTANLGPGFDTLGIALRLYNRVRLTRSSGTGPRIMSPIAETARAGATAILGDAARLFFRRTRQRPFGIDVHLSGNVPIARGLGSSVTVRLGVLAGLDALSGAGLSRQRLFELVTELEGHPDNAAPAVFGGFTAAGIIDGAARCVRLAVPPRFAFVALIPPFEVPTKAARRLVPGSFSKADTVHNLTRVALITAAFGRGDADALRGLFADRIHQPYRERLIPQLSRVIRAGERAGAVGGWLSGSGSTIICLAENNTAAVARAMSRQLPGSAISVIRADPRGYRVEASRQPSIGLGRGRQRPRSVA
jgi:homoserine kinase